MSGQQHPQVRWVTWARATQGLVARCEVCGASATAGTPEGVHAFAAAHQEHRSAAPGHFGLGDAIAAGTKALGVEPCSPCEARRRQLNGLLPRIWPRRG